LVYTKVFKEPGSTFGTLYVEVLHIVKLLSYLTLYEVIMFAELITLGRIR